MLSEADFQTVLKENPTLTSFGFVDPSDARFAEQRELIAKSYDAARLSAEWLWHYRVPRGFDSYTVKHCIEHEFAPCYVPEGAAIAAAVHLGIPGRKGRYLVFDRPAPKDAKIAAAERHEWHPIRQSRGGLLSLPKPANGDVSVASYPTDRFPGPQTGYVIGTAWGWKRIEDRPARMLVQLGKSRLLDGSIDLPQRPPLYKPERDR